MYKLGLIGNFISESQMPSLMLKLSNEFNISLNYRLFDFSKKKMDLKNFITELRKNNYSGIGVTFPFKEKILQFSDEMSQEVKLIKSSNILQFKNKIIARNTDFTGFLESMKFHFNEMPKRVLVIGCGGVGRAVCFALNQLNVEHLYLIEPNKKKLKILLDEMETKKIKYTSIIPEEVFNLKDNIDGIVNCSPVGHKSCKGNPLPNFDTNGNQWVYDVVYTPAKTEFLKKAKLNKSKIIYGIDLFIFQGIEAFILLTEQHRIREHIYNKVKEIRSYYFDKLINHL